MPIPSVKSIKQEYNKEYRLNNKEIISEQKKEYRFNNKEIISEQRKIKDICDCGGKYRKCDKSRHLKTLLHQNYLKTLDNPIV